jgi:hypothetical protein
MVDAVSGSGCHAQSIWCTAVTYNNSDERGNNCVYLSIPFPSTSETETIPRVVVPGFEYRRAVVRVGSPLLLLPEPEF